MWVVYRRAITRNVVSNADALCMLRPGSHFFPVGIRFTGRVSEPMHERVAANARATLCNMRDPDAFYYADKAS